MKLARACVIAVVLLVAQSSSADFPVWRDANGRIIGTYFGDAYSLLALAEN